MKTYRYSGHSRSDAGAYRLDGELDEWKQRDPIDIFRARLLDAGEATDEQLAELDSADRPAGQVRRGGSAGEPAAGGRRDVSPRHGRGPLMRHTLTIPKLGDSVSEVVILEWHVAVGDTVAVGDPLVSVETDKIDADVPSTVAGTVVELLVEPTDEVATGAPFVVVDES